MDDRVFVSFGLDNPSNVNPSRNKYWWDSLKVPNTISTETIREVLHISLDTGEEVPDAIERCLKNFREQYKGKPLWVRIDCQFAIRLNKLFTRKNNLPDGTIDTKVANSIKEYMNTFMRTFVKSAYPLLKTENAEYTNSSLWSRNCYGATNENAVIRDKVLNSAGWENVYYKSLILAEIDLNYQDKLGVPATAKEASEMFKSRSLLKSDSLRLTMRNKAALKKFDGVLQKLKAGDSEYVVSAEYITGISTEKLIRDFMSKEYDDIKDIIFDIAISDRLRASKNPDGTTRQNGYNNSMFRAATGSVKLDDKTVNSLDGLIRYYTEALDMFKRCRNTVKILTDYKEKLGSGNDRAAIASYLDRAARVSTIESKLWNKARELGCRITEADEIAIEEEGE